jgi:hypothetical protein
MDRVSPLLRREQPLPLPLRLLFMGRRNWALAVLRSETRAAPPVDGTRPTIFAKAHIGPVPERQLMPPDWSMSRLRWPTVTAA